MSSHAKPKVGVNTGRAGLGRPKGASNKTTAAVKEMIVAALGECGGVSYLVEQARTNPTAFLALLGEVLALQVKADGLFTAIIDQIEATRAGAILSTETQQ